MALGDLFQFAREFGVALHPRERRAKYGGDLVSGDDSAQLMSRHAYHDHVVDAHLLWQALPGCPSVEEEQSQDRIEDADQAGVRREWPISPRARRRFARLSTGTAGTAAAILGAKWNTWWGGRAGGLHEENLVEML